MSDSHDSLNITSIRPRYQPAPGASPYQPSTPPPDPAPPAAPPTMDPTAYQATPLDQPAAANTAAPSTIRMDDHLPSHRQQAGHHPARLHTAHIPAAPTSDLITDKQTLATKLQDADSDLVSRIKLPPFAKPALIAAAIFILALILFKSPVIISQIQYSLSKPKATDTAPATNPSSAVVIPAENTITIPKINVHAPVIYEPSVVEANVQRALQDGVVHYGNTAAPGQNGNAAIFGHSSNDWWEPGNYKFVFVLLDKLTPGDKITIDYQSRRYIYEVTGSKIVEPTDISVLKPTAAPTLSLITCTPPGTSLRRLVVTAKQIDPAPEQAAATPTPSSTPSESKLPSSAKSFGEKIQAGWDSLINNIKSLLTGNKAKSTTPTPTSSQLPTAK